MNAATPPLCLVRENVSATRPLIVDRVEIERFVTALFRYAETGFVSYRAFDQFDNKRPPILIEGAAINGDLASMVSRAVELAQRCAETSSPSVFAPPICVLDNPTRARGVDLVAGLVLSVEVDDGDPDVAVAVLEGLLGYATVVIHSGSEWRNPDTGEVKPKIHAHWRLNEPTTTPQDHARLRQARDMAARLIGADPTGKPIVHPLRWPGSWNLKTTPRMARIARLNETAEIDLSEALERLGDAIEAAGLDNADIATGSRNPQAPIPHVISALAAIPNPNAEVHYDEWIRLGYAVHNATGGASEGFDAWDAWSRKSDKYDGGQTEAAWKRITAAIDGTNAPVKVGAGTIFFLAQQAGWDRPRQAVLEFKGQGTASESAAPDSGGENDDGSDRPPAFTDEALALQFADQHRDRLRFVAVWNRWMIREPAIWKFDETLQAFDLARAVCRRAAAACNTKAATGIASAKTVAAVERLAKADRLLAVTVDKWDADPWLLNTLGGVVDLRTGVMRAHRSDDYFTKITAVAPGGECPLWRRFLARITANDADLQAFLQRIAGYALTGITTEHALFFLYGTGANGKGTFLNTLTGIMGGYAAVSTMETFTASQSDRHPTDLAMLRGARLVTAQETEEGRRWAESRIKALTGGDPITARFMRQDFFTFFPQFKLFIAGNHKPGLRNVDEAMRRRLHMVPFAVKIEKNERDPDLADKLKAEWPGILRWMIDGCLAWRTKRLSPPPVVTQATDDYLRAEDAMGLWLAECCDVDSNKTVGSTALFESWKEWAEAAGEWVGSQRRFSQALEARGFTPGRSGGGGKASFEGIALKVAGRRTGS